MGAAPILTILKNGETVKTHSLQEEGVLGRGDGCVIRLEDRAISRQHAVFRPTADGVQVEKKSEFAPLVVNGAECSSAVVKEGDVISIGPYLVRVSMPKEKAAPAAPAPAPEAADAKAPLEVSAETDSPPEPQESPEAQSESIESGSELQMESGPGAADGESQQGDDVSVAEEGAQGADAPAEDHVDFAAADDDGKTKLTPTAKVQIKLIFEPGTSNVSEYEITKDEISLGRGKNCDIVLNDKKASRKNTLIRRAGLSFTIKDLDSANGTYVNDVRVTEQELSSDDVIRVGDVQFQFKAVSADYEQKAQDFLVPAIEEEVPGESFDSAPVAMDQAGGPLAIDGAAQQPVMMDSGLAGAAAGAVPGQDPGLAGMQGIPGITGIPGAGGKKKTSFKDLPTRKKVIYGVAFVAIAYFALFDQDPAPKKKAQPKKAAVTASTGAVPGGAAGFENLTPEQQKFVEAQHALAFDLFRNHEYDKAIFEVRKIFALIPDYKNSKEIERYALEGKRKMEALEEERKKKEEEEKFKIKLAELIKETGEKMHKKQYPQAKELFSSILAMDPENQQVVAWQKQIQDEEDEKKAQAEAKRVREELNKQEWQLLRDAQSLQTSGKYFAAIDAFKKVIDNAASDKRPADKAKAAIEECKQSINNKRDPVLAEARQLEANKQYFKAYKKYEEASQIDPYHPEAPEAMKRISQILDEKGKKLYTQAVIAESYSDFTGAERYFRQCVAVTPADDEYHQRALDKLGRYPASVGGQSGDDDGADDGSGDSGGDSAGDSGAPPAGDPGSAPSAPAAGDAPGGQ